MSTTIIVTKLKTIQWIMLQHTITKPLEIWEGRDGGGGAFTKKMPIGTS